MSTRVVTAGIVTAIALIGGAPPTIAESFVIDPGFDYAYAEQDSDGKGQTVMGCLGPLFIDCSVASAWAVGGCKDVKVTTLCASTSLAAAGGLSSVALTGGGATGVWWEGTNAPGLLDCTWAGTAGGCVVAVLNFDFSCIGGVTAKSSGYVDLRVAGPPVTAEAPTPCGILSVAQPAPQMTADQAQARLRQEAAQTLDEGLAALERSAAAVGANVDPADVASYRAAA